MLSPGQRRVCLVRTRLRDARSATSRGVMEMRVCLLPSLSSGAERDNSRRFEGIAGFLASLGMLVVLGTLGDIS